MLIAESDNNKLHGNVVSNNSGNGIILINGANGNTVRGNDVMDNAGFWGILSYTFPGDPIPKENLIQGNTVLGHGADLGEVDSSCPNKWKGNIFSSALDATTFGPSDCID